MKHVILSVATLLFCLAQANAQSQLSSDVSYAARSLASISLTQDSVSMRIHLFCENSTGERVRISIRSEQGELYNNVTTEKSIAKTFDLQQLEDGWYDLIVLKGTERLQKTVRIESVTVTQRRQVLQ